MCRDNTHKRIQEETLASHKRIQESLAYLGKHQYIEATTIWRQLCEESMSKVISVDITDSAINVHTTALNLDLKSLIKMKAGNADGV